MATRFGNKAFIPGAKENVAPIKGKRAGMATKPATKRYGLSDVSNKETCKNTHLKANTTFKKPVLSKPKPVVKEEKKVVKVASKLPVKQEKGELVKVPAATRKIDNAPEATLLVAEETVPMDISLDKAKVKSEEIDVVQVSFSKLRFNVEDVDAEDTDNPQLVAMYVKDIYNYLHILETRYPIAKWYLGECLVTERHRRILIDWLILVHARLTFLQETLYLTISILDRFLQANRLIRKGELQLVGVSCMFLAAKYEEMYLPCMKDFVFLADDSFKESHIKQMEIEIFKAIDCHLGYPLPIHFLRRNSKTAGANSEQHGVAKYFLELCVCEYSMAHLKPSTIAAASLCLAIIVLGDDLSASNYSDCWHETIEYYSGYSYDELLPIMREIAAICLGATEKKSPIAQKYAASTFLKVSLKPQLNGSIMREFAKETQLYRSSA